MHEIKVIDIFAGPGGLGEGFASLADSKRKRHFKLSLSIEMDKYAHETLELRSFMRKFEPSKTPSDYYEYLRENIPKEELYESYKYESESAKKEAWLAELGKVSNSAVNDKISTALSDTDKWVLVGGPPCQAYSLVGRSRRMGYHEDNLAISPDDKRVYLYREYLRILAIHSPPVFIMENVKGLLSASLNTQNIFNRILNDLEQPSRIFRRYPKKPGYQIYPLTIPNQSESQFGDLSFTPQDYIVRCENYGIPQARHRVILLGIRNDLDLSYDDIDLLKEKKHIPINRVLKDLPPLRSGLSKTDDSNSAWENIIISSVKSEWFNEIDDKNHQDLIRNIISSGSFPDNRGVNALTKYNGIGKNIYMKNWFHDPNLRGACNHDTRGHMETDLHRYLYMSTYGKLNKKSPDLDNMPESLLPDHKNIKKGHRKYKSGHFKDRFRVQLSNKAATTITSHISKDGHYYIHYDPSQCRSLTVREAARIQTFPDNYFFCGPRTEQYKQVGNAVPPLLAKQIAKTVFSLLK